MKCLVPPAVKSLTPLTLCFCVVSGLWACTSECTQNNCLNTVTFIFTAINGDPIQGTAGEVTIGGTEIEFDCSAQVGADGSEYRCVENALVVYASEAPFATIDVAGPTSQVTYSGTVNLTFESVFPNGEGCPGECRSSTENVVVLRADPG